MCAAVSHSLTLASPVGHVAVMDECLLTPSWVCSIIALICVGVLPFSPPFLLLLRLMARHQLDPLRGADPAQGLLPATVACFGVKLLQQVILIKSN